MSNDFRHRHYTKSSYLKIQGGDVRNLVVGIRYRTVLTVEIVFIDLKTSTICILMILVCLYFIKVDVPN